MQLSLPFPPSVNTYWRHIQGTRPKISKRGRQYKKDVAALVLVQRANKLLGGPLFVRISAFPPDTRIRDLDNIFKALFDAMGAAGVYVDDNQIKKIHAEMHSKVKGGKVVIDILPLKPRGGK